MSDETKRLKDEEQASWGWTRDAASSDDLKSSNKKSGELETDSGADFASLFKRIFGTLLFGALLLFVANNGFDFSSFGRFWWLLFIIPTMIGDYSSYWTYLLLLILLFSGALSGAYWFFWGAWLSAMLALVIISMRSKTVKFKQ